jgi:hypothetical protein
MWNVLPPCLHQVNSFPSSSLSEIDCLVAGLAHLSLPPHTILSGPLRESFTRLLTYRPPQSPPPPDSSKAGACTPLHLVSAPHPWGGGWGEDHLLLCLLERFNSLAKLLHTSEERALRLLRGYSLGGPESQLPTANLFIE